MLDKNSIYDICKERLNYFKNLDLTKLDPQLVDEEPFYIWIQQDPKKLKAKAIIEKVKIITKRLITAKNEKEQKKIIKEVVFGEILTCVSLYPVFLFPNPENNDLNFLSYRNISEENLINYLKYLIKVDKVISKSGITAEKSFLNGANIIQTYSISTILYLIFQECAYHLGLDRKKFFDEVYNLRTSCFEDVLKLIPMITSNQNIDVSRYKPIDAIKTLFNTDRSLEFINEDD